MINRTVLNLEREIPRRVAAAEKNVRDMKNKQYLGGDNTVYGSSNFNSAVFVVSAGTAKHISASVTPTDGRLQNWDFRLSVWVDLPSATLDLTLLLPVGSALTAGQKKIRLHPWGDYATSDDSTGKRQNYVTIENNDTVDHTLTVFVIWYAILTQGVAA